VNGRKGGNTTPSKKTENKKQKTKNSKQKTETRKQKTKKRKQKTENTRIHVPILQQQH